MPETCHCVYNAGPRGWAVALNSQTLQPTQVSSPASWLPNFQVAGPESEAGRGPGLLGRRAFLPCKVLRDSPSRSSLKSQDSDAEQQA